MKKCLSRFLCGYRKSVNTQTDQLGLVEKWKASPDKQGYAGVILMYLSKEFETIDHELQLTKLNAYGFDTNSLQIIQSYLSNNWQRTTISSTYL